MKNHVIKLSSACEYFAASENAHAQNFHYTPYLPMVKTYNNFSLIFVGRKAMEIIMKYTYKTKGTCSMQINFNLDGDIVTGVEFIGGCNGNLKAISKLVDGLTVDEIENKLLGNTCGFKNTSCADQLAKAVRQAKEAK